MLDALNITEEEALGLAELAQHDLALARDFARRAQAAEDSAEASGLARSYQRAARSYRQTLALKARLQRELAAAAHVQANTPRPKPGGAAVARRRRASRTSPMRRATAAPPGRARGVFARAWAAAARSRCNRAFSASVWR